MIYFSVVQINVIRPLQCKLHMDFTPPFFLTQYILFWMSQMFASDRHKKKVSITKATSSRFVSLYFHSLYWNETKKQCRRHRQIHWIAMLRNKKKYSCKNSKTITFERHLTDNQVYYCEIKSQHNHIVAKQSLEPFNVNK